MIILKKVTTRRHILQNSFIQNNLEIQTLTWWITNCVQIKYIFMNTNPANNNNNTEFRLSRNNNSQIKLSSITVIQIVKHINILSKHVIKLSYLYIAMDETMNQITIHK